MIEPLLEKLDGVIETGNRHWRAKCPAHESHSRSLSLSEAEDGRILMHCFAGCESFSVLSAIGMRLSDLFPDSGKSHGKTHTNPAHAAYAAMNREAALALDVLDHESLIIVMGLLQTKPLTEADHERMLVARDRIQDVRKLIRKNRAAERRMVQAIGAKR